MTELTVLIGLPGAGKSTYAKEYIEKQVCSGNVFWEYCSSDRTRRKLYGDENIQGKPDTVFNTLHRDVETHLKRGTNVVYDATNVSRKNRKQIILLGKKYNCIVKGIVVWAPVDVCIERDSLRERTVGKAVIMKMLKRFEVPYFDEGFDRIEVHNTIEDFNENEYRTQLLDAMRIPHDNPHHTFDVDEHCFAAQAYARSKGMNSIVCEAALWHDVGKPLAKFFKESATTANYYNHDNIGGYLLLGFSEYTFLMFIPWLVSNHMQPFFDSHYYRGLPESLKKYIDELHECDLNAH